MGYIRVTHTEFEKTAKAIDEYIDYLDQQMKLADGIIESLKQTSWIGQDSMLFNTQWNEVMEKKSTYSSMKNSLEKYASLLRSIGERYKKAQEDAYSRAMRLSGRWSGRKRSKDEKNNKKNRGNSDGVYGSDKYGSLHRAGSDTGKAGGTGTGGTLRRGI